MSNPSSKSIIYCPVAGFFCRHYARPTYEREMINEGNRLISDVTGKNELILKKSPFYNFTTAVVGSVNGAAIHLIPALLGLNIVHRMGASNLAEKACAVTILAIPAVTNMASCIYESVRLVREK